tara:strand:+ start:39504 stop:40886 length:1383 start_codon:yes stop_codon:yes gene_type:complete
MKYSFVNFLRSHKIIFILLFFSFLLFNFNSQFHIKNFNKYFFYDDGTSYHGIIRTPPEIKIWKKSYEFKEDSSLENWQDEEFRWHFLPSKNLAFIGKIMNMNFYDENNNYDLTGIIFFFIFQTFIYYSAVIYFYNKLLNLNIRREITYIVCFFLLFEPTINQWNTTIFGETIFFALIIFIFSFLIDLPKENYKYIFFGILLGICYLQRSVAMFLIIVPLIVIFIKFKKKSTLKIINTFLSYLIILMLIGLLNYNRSNIFYFLPTQTIDNLYNYFLPKVEQKRLNISSKKSLKILSDKNDILINEHNLDLKKEEDRIKLYNLQRNIAVEILLNNKIITIEKAFKSYLHSTLLNPVEVLNTRIKGREYYKSKLHKKFIKYRIIYSALIFGIVFLGFIYAIKKKIFFPHIILACGIYFFIISGWVGYTRYFIPTFLSFCVYFAYGLLFIFNKITSYKFNKITI